MTAVISLANGFFYFYLLMNVPVDLATEYYEHACEKVDNSLELLRGLFNCYARQSSFAKQLKVRGCLRTQYIFYFILDLLGCYLIITNVKESGLFRPWTPFHILLLFSRRELSPPTNHPRTLLISQISAIIRASLQSL